MQNKNQWTHTTISSLGLFGGSVCVCVVFPLVDLLSSCMGHVLDVPKAKLDKKLYCHAEREKKKKKLYLLNCLIVA